MPNKPLLSTRLSSATMRAHRVLSVWLVGDTLYAALPIGILALIDSVRGDSFAGFFLRKEWSFAAIVLFGVGIRRMIRLKVYAQGIPRSYTLDVGVQLLAVLLVTAAVTLALVILNEKGVGLGVEAPKLGYIQVSLFCFGAFMLLASQIAEERFSAAANRLPLLAPREMVVLHIDLRLAHANEILDYVAYASRKALDVAPSADDVFRETRFLTSKLESLDYGLTDAAKFLSEIRTNLERIRAT